MPRSSSYDVVLDAGLFTPLQLQTVAVARLGFQAGTRWMRDHVCSHRTLLSHYQAGLVMWAWQLDYEKPLRFVDADEVRVEATVRVRGPRASQLEVAMTISGPCGVAVRTRATSVPLRLSGDQALSGTPTRLPDPLIGQFPDDERERSPYRSRVPALRAALEREGQRLASATVVSRIYQHHCEMADQWYWVESLGFAGSAREELIMKHGGTAPGLRRALTEGIRSVDVAWLRAAQMWDLIEIRSTGYRHGDAIAFVHELGLASDDGGGPYAIVVEHT